MHLSSWGKQLCLGRPAGKEHAPNLAFCGDLAETGLVGGGAGHTFPGRGLRSVAHVFLCEINFTPLSGEDHGPTSCVHI